MYISESNELRLPKLILILLLYYDMIVLYYFYWFADCCILFSYYCIIFIVYLSFADYDFVYRNLMYWGRPSFLSVTSFDSLVPFYFSSVQ